MSLTMPEVKAEWERWIIREQLAQKTRNSWRSRLNHFLLWLDEQPEPPRPIRWEDVFCLSVMNAYHDYLIQTPVVDRLTGHKRERSTGDIKAYADMLRSVTKYLLDTGKASVRPYSFKAPTVTQSDRPLVSMAEIEQLWQAVPREQVEYKRALYAAVLSALVHTGLRCFEVADLRVGDVLRETMEGIPLLIVQRGKGRRGGKRRELPMCEEAQLIMREWLAIRSHRRCSTRRGMWGGEKVKESEQVTDYLFHWDHKTPVTDDGVRKILERIKTLAGLQDHANIKPHSCRHWSASYWHNKMGIPLDTVSTMLGHTRLEITKKYLHVDRSDFKNAAKLMNTGFVALAKPDPETTPVAEPVMEVVQPPAPLKAVDPAVIAMLAQAGQIEAIRLILSTG